MKPNDHYIVKNRTGYIIYRCTTGILSEEYVLKEIIRMFENNRCSYTVYKNGQLIHHINNINHDLRRTEYILDMETGDTYKDCYEMADQLGCTYLQAKSKIKKSFRFKLIKRDIL